MSDTTISNVLLELMKVSKSIYKVIATSITRNNKVDELIKMMVPWGVDPSTSQPVEQDNVGPVEDHVGNDNGDDSNESEGGLGHG